MPHVVTADNLNFHDRHADLFGDSPPFVTRERPWIHAVGDDSLANAQVVGSHRMGNGVPSRPPQPTRLAGVAGSIESMRR